MSIRRPQVPLLVLALAVLLPPASAGDRAEIRPYDLGVRVVADPAAGASAVLADDLRAVLIDELVARACYRSVRAVEDDRREPGQLVFKVRIDLLENRTEHDVSLARRELSDRPEDRSRYRLETRLQAEAGLLAPGSDTAILSKPYRVRIVERPRFVGHDPEPEVRARLLDDFAEQIAKIACKPDAARLAGWVREAAEESVPDDPAR